MRAPSRTFVPCRGRDWTRVLPLPLDGKEGVNGSSPLEGFRKGQQMAFFVAAMGYDRFSSDPQTIPRSLPTVGARLLSWA
jgi:hypothetical protein